MAKELRGSTWHAAISCQKSARPGSASCNAVNALVRVTEQSRRPEAVAHRKGQRGAWPCPQATRPQSGCRCEVSPRQPSRVPRAVECSALARCRWQPAKLAKGWLQGWRQRAPAPRFLSSGVHAMPPRFESRYTLWVLESAKRTLFRRQRRRFLHGALDVHCVKGGRSPGSTGREYVSHMQLMA